MCRKLNLVLGENIFNKIVAASTSLFKVVQIIKLSVWNKEHNTDERRLVDKPL